MSLVKQCPIQSTLMARNQFVPSSSNDAPSPQNSRHAEDCLGPGTSSANATYSYFSPFHSDEGITEISPNGATNSLLDDALSAAMEAIDETDRFSARDALCAIGPEVATLPTVPVNSSFESLEKANCNLSFQSMGSSRSSTDELLKHEYEKIDEPEDYKEAEKKHFILNAASTKDAVDLGCEQTGAAAPTLRTSPSHSSLILPSTSAHSNWRFLLRPIFEAALVERLWKLGELGSSSPQALLLSIWFILSRHFGVGCRNDHAKLLFGCLDVGLDAATGERQLRFFRTVDDTFRESEDGTFSRDPSCRPDQVVPAQPDRPERCPVRLFETYCARRLPSVSFPNSPLYLQPERTAVTNCQLAGAEAKTIWYSISGLGKNKIGSMLNFALQSVGMPISGQANLHRICDVLTTLALTPASGAVGLRLAELTASCWKSETTMLREELESCAYHIVREAATRGSPINQMLTRLCSIKAFSVRHSRSASKTCLAALPLASGQSAPVMMSSASDLILSRGSTTCRPITAAPLKPSH
ncbi:unnamed protein product, partial [Dicrocoelium dendriticum]